MSEPRIQMRNQSSLWAVTGLVGTDSLGLEGGGSPPSAGCCPWPCRLGREMSSSGSAPGASEHLGLRFELSAWGSEFQAECWEAQPRLLSSLRQRKPRQARAQEKCWSHRGRQRAVVAKVRAGWPATDLSPMECGLSAPAGNRRNGSLPYPL